MTPLHTNARRRSARHRGSDALRLTGAVILLASATLAGTLATPDAAAAAPLGITSPADGSLQQSRSVTLTGTKSAGTRIEVPSLVAGNDPYCVIDSPAEEWSCTLTLADGTSTLTAVEYAPADSSAVPPVAEAVVGSTSVTLRVLGAPTVDGGDPYLTSGLISGSGFAGAGILVSGSGPESFSTACGVVQASGYWSCALPVTTSGSYSVQVRQTWPGTGEEGGISPARTVTIDKVPPAAPVITRPTAGERITTQPVNYAGTGEAGARVEVFVDGVIACSSTVSGGAWACSANGVGSGDHTVQAIQWDAAGNPSGASAPVAVIFGAAPTVPGKPAPVPPTGPGAPVPSPDPTPGPTKSPDPRPALPFFPPPIGGDSGLPPGATWGTPTHYGAAIPSPLAGLADGAWISGLLLGLGFVALVALPLRLLVATLRGRVSWRGRQIAGRNRYGEAEDERPLLNPWVTAASALAGAVLLAALAGGIQAEVRYLRLAFAIGIALVVLNGVGVALTTKLTSRALGELTGIRLVPMFLVVGAVSALISRGGGIQPPIIIGIVIAATFAPGMTRRSRGIVALAQLAAVTLLGFGAWLLHGWLGPVEGFWASLASESLGALCIAALGSVALLLVPVSRLPGRSVFEWSKPAWFAIAIPAATLAATVIATGEHFPTGLVVGIALVFAAVSVATWSWIRFVEPQLAAGDA